MRSFCYIVVSEVGIKPHHEKGTSWKKLRKEPENVVNSCVPFCVRSLAYLERCDGLLPDGLKNYRPKVKNIDQTLEIVGIPA